MFWLCLFVLISDYEKSVSLANLVFWVYCWFKGCFIVLTFVFVLVVFVLAVFVVLFASLYNELGIFYVSVVFFSFFFERQD